MIGTAPVPSIPIFQMVVSNSSGLSALRFQVVSSIDLPSGPKTTLPASSKTLPGFSFFRASPFQSAPSFEKKIVSPSGVTEKTSESSTSGFQSPAAGSIEAIAILPATRSERHQKPRANNRPRRAGLASSRFCSGYCSCRRTRGVLVPPIEPRSRQQNSQGRSPRSIWHHYRPWLWAVRPTKAVATATSRLTNWARPTTAARRAQVATTRPVAAATTTGAPAARPEWPLCEPSRESCGPCHWRPPAACLAPPRETRPSAGSRPHKRGDFRGPARRPTHRSILLRHGSTHAAPARQSGSTSTARRPALPASGPNDRAASRVRARARESYGVRRARDWPPTPQATGSPCGARPTRRPAGWRRGRCALAGDLCIPRCTGQLVRLGLDRRSRIPSRATSRAKRRMRLIPTPATKNEPALQTPSSHSHQFHCRIPSGTVERAARHDDERRQAANAARRAHRNGRRWMLVRRM